MFRRHQQTTTHHTLIMSYDAPQMASTAQLYYKILTMFTSLGNNGVPISTFNLIIIQIHFVLKLRITFFKRWDPTVVNLLNTMYPLIGVEPLLAQEVYALSLGLLHIRRVIVFIFRVIKVSTPTYRMTQLKKHTGH